MKYHDDIRFGTFVIFWSKMLGKYVQNVYFQQSFGDSDEVPSSWRLISFKKKYLKLDLLKNALRSGVVPEEFWTFCSFRLAEIGRPYVALPIYIYTRAFSMQPSRIAQQSRPRPAQHSYRTRGAI